MPACDGAPFTIEREAEFAVARAARKIADCATCGGTGLERTTLDDRGRKYEVSRPCKLATLEARLAMFNAAHVPAVHAHSSFETFRNPQNIEVDRAKKLAYQFAYRWPHERGFLLSGPVGTGKTHLLVAALRHLTTELGVSAAYIEISLLYATIRRGFREGRSGGEIITPLSEVPVLAIDELGKGRLSPFEMETLDELIARRYNGGKVTLFATNFLLAPPEAQPKDKGDPSRVESRYLFDKVDARIYSRLCEMCDFVEFPQSTMDVRRARRGG